MTTQCYFPLAVLKGVIEHDDGTAYFGSLGGYEHYVSEAIASGWLCKVDSRLTPTVHGIVVYRSEKLYELPQHKLSRAYLWDWQLRWNTSEHPKP